MWLIYEKETDTRAVVALLTHQPTEEQKLNGFPVNDAPDVPYQIGKISVLYTNPQTQELWFEYVDRPLTIEEQFVKQQERIDLMQSALDDLILGGTL
jgi:hypothetical protein